MLPEIVWTSTRGASDWVHFFFDVSLRSALILFIAAIATSLMRRASAAARHLVWSCAIVASLCLPLLAALLPGWNILPTADIASPPGQTLVPFEAPTPDTEVVRIPFPGGRTALALAPLESRPVIDGFSLLAGLWAIGMAALLLRPVLGRLKLGRLSRRASDPPPDMTATIEAVKRGLGVHRPVRVLIAHTDVMPMTWGIVRPVVLLSHDAPQWPAVRQRTVLLHEFAHIQRQDCFTQLLAQLVRAIYWFNPLAWLAAWRMSIERERACDDLVLNAGVRQSEYATELLELSTRLSLPARSTAALAMARPSRIAQRLTEILDDRRNRAALSARFVLVVAGVAALVTFPAACVRSHRNAEQTDMRHTTKTTQPVALTLEQRECQQNLTILIRAAHLYSQENRGALPESLGATMQHPKTSGGGTIEEAIEQITPNAPRKPLGQYYLCPEDPKYAEAPTGPTAEWIDQNTLYEHLAGDLLNGIGEFPNTVMMHERLGWKKHGETINVAFFDGRVEAIQRDEATKVIEESLARIDAAWAKRSNLPKHVQDPTWVDKYGWTPVLTRAGRNIRVAALALYYYAHKHGALPATVGEALPFVDEGPSPHAARMFLLPRDQLDLKMPDPPTNEWVTQHTSFVYLGAGIDPRKLDGDTAGKTVLLHTKLDAPLIHPKHGEEILLAFFDGHAEMFPVDAAKGSIEASTKTLDALRGSSPASRP